MRSGPIALAVLLTAGVVTATAPASAAPDPTADAVRAVADWTGPLSTRGRYIVDANGNRFKLKAGNWHGASGTWTGSGDVNDPANHHVRELAHQTPLNLDRVPLEGIIDGFVDLGLNSVRLPFSNEMIHDSRPVPDLPANPQLRGMTPLQVYDRVVERLTARGFAVVLNNHTNTSRWCCGVDGNERWNTSQTEQRWQDDWLFMARRYAGNERVVGADLYNEVRRDVTDDPNWGWGNDHDWQRASQRVGDRILTEANPNLLIIVEGINWTGLPVDGFPHGRPTLEPARTLSHTLVESGKLVYSAHFYGYTGPNHSGATGIGETSDPRYQDLTPQQLREVVHRQALYVSAETGKHFTAPVWVSEFGAGGRGNDDPKSRDWFERFVDILVEADADFAYWPVVGQHGGSGDGWSLLAWDAAGNRIGVHDSADWRGPAWRRLVGATGRTGQVPPTERWSMLNLDYADFQASKVVRAKPDWNPGARKGVCPNGQRLIGLADVGGRGLCTGTAPTPQAHVTVRDESFVDTDWAGGYTKVQCPRDHYVVGYSLNGAAFSAALCARSATPLGSGGRAVWFDRGDNRPGGDPGGEFAPNRYKGQCASDEHIAGIAYTGRIFSDRGPDALYCRQGVPG
ncbi:aryl-phospho-beta-D-glucosidase BglC (GH1 family) [Saccharothrix coeruleofusca]|uniref:glycoside hydrolase family 5 protein n=1 Tax=Saccharothrix coeruleofusca TaxID=33919 RepID=UPI0027DE7593|nr:cellulase family glycosylhydrolase [Saccharothrix coeruleofusca]MBP2335660.1 aryl-phospho-beta-D-glucosidase BglC (GH1 family) [Saccharothrix coeruleofusca]